MPTYAFFIILEFGTVGDALRVDPDQQYFQHDSHAHGVSTQACGHYGCQHGNSHCLVRQNGVVSPSFCRLLPLTTTPHSLFYRQVYVVHGYVRERVDRAAAESQSKAALSDQPMAEELSEQPMIESTTETNA
jgi:hypothetical protein